MKALPKQIRQVFAKHKVLNAYQFGSSLTGNFRKDSDIDLAVLFDRSVSKKNRFNGRAL